MITKPTKYTEEFVLSEITGFWSKVKSDSSLMFWQDLIRDKEYSRERIWEWKNNKDWPEISNLCKKIHDEFELRLTKGAMLGKLNPGMTIFIFKNHYGMSDKLEQKTENTGEGLTFTINKIITKDVRGNEDKE